MFCINGLSRVWVSSENPNFLVTDVLLRLVREYCKTYCDCLVYKREHNSYKNFAFYPILYNLNYLYSLYN